jgi:probable phosphoglycerate mutase
MRRRYHGALFRTTSASMDTLYVVRHGQTEWNVEDRFQGRLDSPLTPAGWKHAQEHGELLARERIEHLISSPLGRARSTAERIHRRIGIALAFDDRLVERDCGEWSGLTSTEIQRAYPNEWAERVRSPYFHRPPRGENLLDMLARVKPLLEELCTLPHRRVALVSHGLMGRVIVSHLLGIPPEEASVVRQPNDVVYRIAFGRAVECMHFRNGSGPHAGYATAQVRSE